MTKPRDRRNSVVPFLLRQIALAAGLAAGLAACSSPLYDQPDRDFRRIIRESAERELTEARESPDVMQLSREDRTPALEIKPETLRELDDMAGPTSYARKTPNLGPSLFNTHQKTVPVTLEHAITSSLRNNLNVQFARLAPAISSAQVAAADAAFDWILFSNNQWSYTDEPRTATAIGGSVVGVRSDQRQVLDTTTGVRKPLISGGQFTVQHQYTYTDNETSNLFTLPDPAKDTNIVMQLDQPLLRGFGSAVTLAQVRLAQNTERDEIQALKATLIQTATETETAFWGLVRAQWDLMILDRLLERGEEVLRILKSRRFDIKPSQISDSVSTVETRRADLIRAQRIVREASDRLKVLMNDPDILVGSEVLIDPVDETVDQAVRFSLIDSVNVALANRPEIQRAIISLDNTSIRLGVADNGRLPQLNFRALMRFSGQGSSGGSAYEDLTDADFIDYQIALNFEQAIGNRRAEAEFSQRRFERMQARIAYQNTVQGVVSEVKSALREITSTYQLIEATRASRIANAENLRTLQVEEQTTQGLTPDFLDRKLRAQQGLAAAEQQEITSLIDYNNAMARLYAAMGTALERNQVIFDVQNVVPERSATDLFPDWSAEEQAGGN